MESVATNEDLDCAGCGCTSPKKGDCSVAVTQFEAQLVVVVRTELQLVAVVLAETQLVEVALTELQLVEVAVTELQLVEVALTELQLVARPHREAVLKTDAIFVNMLSKK
jgi:hypothetical protein